MSKEDIVDLRKLNYSWSKIAQMLGISRQTLYRRLKEFNISTCDFTDVLPQELDEIVKEVKVQYPNDGEVMLKGHMSRLNVKVPRADLRAAIHRVDHDNTVARRSKAIKRRVYCVARPNNLWHIDGNHKMIRWRFVVHGGVDGFSRTVVFLNCADNNCAPTVLQSFLKAVSHFGLPERVRSDHGGENIDVWRYMLSAHNNDPACVVTGSSTHNERIERLWRDVYRSVSSNFIDVFSTLENEEVLDTLNEVDMYCLHYIFLPRINKCLSEFQQSWNHHSLSTEGSRSPYQLFVEGLSVEEREDDHPTSAVERSTTEDLNELEAVVVPHNTFTPCEELYSCLQGRVNPLSDSTDFGKSLYYQAIRCVGNHLQLGCANCVLSA